MTERIIELNDISLVDFFGVNEKNLNFLSILFPKVELIQRGNTLKIIAKEKDIEEFEKVYNQLVELYHQESRMDEKLIMSIVKPSPNSHKSNSSSKINFNILSSCSFDLAFPA